MEPTFSYIYSVPYIILFLIFFLLFLWERRILTKNGNIKNIRILCMLIFIIFFGFRGYLDTDFSVYYPMYESTPEISDSVRISKFFSNINEDYILHIEPGYKVFLIIMKSISSNYFFLQFISTLIDVFFLNYFFKKYSKVYTLSFILFIIFSGFIIEVNLLRNSKSMLLFLYSIKFIKERKAAKFFLLNLLGLLFHSSSIFYFPVYFFFHKKIPDIFLWFTFVIGNLLYLAQVKYIGPIVSSLGSLVGGNYSVLAETYSGDKMYSTGYGITIGYLERLLTFILFYNFYKKIKKSNQENGFIINIFFNSYFLYSLSYLYLSEFSIFIDRITTLFAYSYWILYPYLYYYYDKIYKQVFTFILFLFGFYKMYKSNNFIIRKYQNIIWDDPTIPNAYYILNKHLDKIQNPPK